MIKGINVTKRFGAKIALNDVSFSIEEGSIYGLIGSNGSGKSTLLRLISGVYRPDEGEIGIDGTPTFDHPELKSQISFLGDTPYFLPQANIEDMARFYASLYPTFNEATYRRLLSVFPLDTRSHISSMSKGMQRQAALTLSMATEPRYLLLDEAFDGLDVVMRRVLANILLDGIEQRGMTTVIASHNLRELEDLSDRIGLIHEGRLLFNDQTELLKGRLHKVQAAFRHVPDLSAFSELQVLHVERTGSLLQMIVRGDQDKIMNFIDRLSPVFSECISPTLEEMFIYELEVTGYDVKNILQ